MRTQDYYSRKGLLQQIVLGCYYRNENKQNNFTLLSTTVQFVNNSINNKLQVKKKNWVIYLYLSGCYSNKPIHYFFCKIVRFKYTVKHAFVVKNQFMPEYCLNVSNKNKAHDS